MIKKIKTDYLINGKEFELALKDMLADYDNAEWDSHEDLIFARTRFLHTFGFFIDSNKK